MHLATIILSWETLALTKRCLSRVLEERKMLAIDGHTMTIVIVDNGSTDGTQDWMREMAGILPDFAGLPLDTNYGTSIARNRAIDLLTKGELSTKYGSPEFIYLLDCDLRPITGSFREMLKNIVKEPKVGVLGMASWHMSPNILDETPVMQPAVIAECQRSPYTGLALAYTQYGIWRTSLFTQHGCRFLEDPPFDRGGHGYEDDDMGGQIEQAGFDLRAIMNCCYLHQFHSSGPAMAKTKVDDANLTKLRGEFVTKKWAGIFKGTGPRGIHPGQ